MRKSLPLISALALMSFTTNAEQVTETDYKRAEQRLSQTTSKLVTGTVNYPRWMSNGQLSYRSYTKEGNKFFTVNAKTQKKSLAFDHQKLAESLARLTETPVIRCKDSARLVSGNLPMSSAEIASTTPADSRLISIARSSEPRIPVTTTSSRVFASSDCS